jgi:hypothetical protein
MDLIVKHKKKIVLGLMAGVYVGLGIATGDMDWTTAATKFVALVGLGAF